MNVEFKNKTKTAVKLRSWSEGTYTNAIVSETKKYPYIKDSGGSPVPEEPLYKVAVFSDQHTTKPTADTDWIAFTNLATAENALAMVGCGDLSVDGDEEELNLWKNMRDVNRGTIPVYTCNGNHESKSVAGYMKFHPELMRQYLDSDTDEGVNYFSKTIGNELYLFVPIFEGVSEHSSQKMFKSDVLEWLHDTLETNRNKRVYVFAHIPPDYHYIPQNFGGVEAYQTYKGSYEWGYPTSETSDRTVFLNLMKRYKNVVWFSGHTHVSYHEAIENNDNRYVFARYDTDGANMVHVSSVTIPSTIEEGNFNPNITAKSECAIMDIYANKIVIKYHDMISGDIDDFVIDTTIIPVAPEEHTLVSIEATKTTTNYNVGDTLQTNDITVTASWSDGSTSNVTADCEIDASEVIMSDEGTYPINISYTYGEVTKETYITITVAQDEPSTWSFIRGIKIDYNTGAETFDNNYGASDYIEVSGRTATYGTTDETVIGGTNPRIGLVCYDSSKTYCGKCAEQNPAGTLKTTTYPSGTKYVKIRFNVQYMSQAKIDAIGPDTVTFMDNPFL